jgi:hypothetical protein
MNREENPALQRMLRTTQIISVALAMGVAIFLGIVIVLGKDKALQGNELVSYFGLLFAVLTLVAAKFVPEVVARSGVRSIAGRDSELDVIERLAGVYQTTVIIRGALLEGAAFLNGVFFMIFGHPLNLFVAAILLAALLFAIPTRRRVLDWMQRQRDALS